MRESANGDLLDALGNDALGGRLIEIARQRFAAVGEEETVGGEDFRAIRGGRRRDVVIFRECGYDTNIVYPFDLFPCTGHVESVVCLTKQSDVI